MNNEQEVSLLNRLETKLAMFSNRTILSIFAICTVSLFFRLIYFPHGLPVTLDATSYFWYAIDTSILGHFPDDYKFPSTGWPMFLSAVFGVFHSSNFLDYMTIQRLTSVSISVITIIPVYFFCKRFFGKSLAIIGAVLFAFEPRTIQNSLLGTSDPLYIFLIIASITLFQSLNTKRIYISFGLAAIAALVRYEGLLFIAVLSILFFVSFRKEKKKFAKFTLAMCVYILILLPSIYVRVHDTGDDGLTSHVIAGAVAPVKITANEANQVQALALFVANGFQNLFKYLGWMTIPYFVFLIPFGFLLMLKNKEKSRFMVVLSIIVLSIPSLYAYSRGIQETRYLLILIPFFVIFSLFTIEKICSKTKKRNIVLFLIVIGVMTSSLMFLELKKTNLGYEKEAFEIAQQVTKNTKVTNVYYPESKYLKITTIEDSNFPILSQKLVKPTSTLSTDGYNTLKEFIQSNKNNGLTHIVADDNKNRPEFMKDVFNHIEKYPYLVRIYDSKEHGYGYQLIIYKIDYDLFEKFNR